VGYQLNRLANLPIDDEVEFYIFVINGNWQEPLYKMVQENFSEIARSIGNHAVIATGLNPKEWYGEVGKTYLGDGYDKYHDLLPALLITDTHPDKLNSNSLRLFVPLESVQERFGGWPQFFDLLSDFVQSKSDEFIIRFREKDDAIEVVNRVVNLKPGACGVSVNLNELISWWRKRAKESKTPLAK
jgi:hypothetical protein